MVFDFQVSTMPLLNLASFERRCVYNLNPQQKPGMFPVIDELEQHVHGVTPYVLGVCCAIGGYFWGLSQDSVPVVVPVAVGFVLGLLLVPLLLKTLSGMLALLIVVAAAVLCFWLLKNDGALRKHDPAAIHRTSPNGTWKQSIDHLLEEVTL